MSNNNRPVTLGAPLRAERFKRIVEEQSRRRAAALESTIDLVFALRRFAVAFVRWVWFEVNT